MDLVGLKIQLHSKGLKMTRPRWAILKILTGETEWMSAKDLHEKLSQTHPIDFSTVCRNLDTLTVTNILCRVDRDNNGSFAYRWPETNRHHHHLICRSCGKISPMEYCPLNQLGTSLTEGFSELECRFEVYGTCNECRIK